MSLREKIYFGIAGAVILGAIYLGVLTNSNLRYNAEIESLDRKCEEMMQGYTQATRDQRLTIMKRMGLAGDRMFELAIKMN